MTAVAPAGTSLAGFFVAETYTDQEAPPGILADAVDPRTGELLSISRGFDPTDAAVLAALSIQQGSGGAVTTAGHRFLDLKVLDDGAPLFIQQETKRVLQPLVDSGQIAIEAVEPVVDGDWAESHVRYRNRIRSQSQAAPLQVGGLL